MMKLWVAEEGEATMFRHSASPANLFFEVRVNDGVLTIKAYDLAWGPATLECHFREATGAKLEVTIPKTPKEERGIARPVPTGTGIPSITVSIPAAYAYSLRNAALLWVAEHLEDPNVPYIREAAERIAEAERQALLRSR